MTRVLQGKPVSPIEGTGKWMKIVRVMNHGCDTEDLCDTVPAELIGAHAVENSQKDQPGIPRE